MKNKESLTITLTIIYLSLVSLCIAIYTLIIFFIKDKDHQGMAVDLLSWSATLFATIALLYTFQSWRQQKGSEVMSSLCQKVYSNLNDLDQGIKDTELKIGNYPLLCKSDNPAQELWEMINNQVTKFNDIQRGINVIQGYEYIEEFKDFHMRINDLIQDYQYFYWVYQDYENRYKTENDKQKLRIDVVLKKAQFIHKFEEFKIDTDTVLIDYVFHRR